MSADSNKFKNLEHRERIIPDTNMYSHCSASIILIVLFLKKVTEMNLNLLIWISVYPKAASQIGKTLSTSAT